MRQLVFFILLLCSNICFSQTSPLGDNLTVSTFDTVKVYYEDDARRIKIESKSQFPFCSRIYKIPKECYSRDSSNCCKYSTDKYEFQETACIGSLNCLNAFTNGYSLNWFYTENISEAKRVTENTCKQLEEQSLSFKKKIVKCYILNKETEGYLYELTVNGNIKLYKLLSYGNYNQYNFTLDYFTLSPITDSNDIPTALREIIRFE